MQKGKLLQPLITERATSKSRKGQKARRSRMGVSTTVSRFTLSKTDVDKDTANAS